jgi:hypothetical protein
LPEYPSDEIPKERKHTHASQINEINPRGTNGEYIPVIGLIFISNARWLEASSHSLVMVLGGGGAAEKGNRSATEASLERQKKHALN